MFQAMQWLSRFFAAERPVSNVEMFNKSSKSLFSFTTDVSDMSKYNMQHGMMHIFLNTSSKIFLTNKCWTKPYFTGSLDPNSWTFLLKTYSETPP